MSSWYCRRLSTSRLLVSASSRSAEPRASRSLTRLAMRCASIIIWPTDRFDILPRLVTILGFLLFLWPGPLLLALEKQWECLQLCTFWVLRLSVGVDLRSVRDWSSFFSSVAASFDFYAEICKKTILIEILTTTQLLADSLLNPKRLLSATKSLAPHH